MLLLDLQCFPDYTLRIFVGQAYGSYDAYLESVSFMVSLLLLKGAFLLFLFVLNINLL